MPVVAGLGNVGEMYSGSRHNVGFEVVRALASRWQLRWTNSGVAWTASGKVSDLAVILVQPRLYMNRSGEALAQLGVVSEVSGLVVVHDEIDLPCGTVRVKFGGGTAGHRGVESIAAHYGPEFVRVRIGVGRPAPGADVAEYVLGRFRPEEATRIATGLRAAADAVECVVERGHQAAMLRFNTRQPEQPVQEPAASKG